MRETCATGMTMQMDRREMVKAAAAAILAAPLAASASGDSPKQVWDPSLRAERDRRAQSRAIKPLVCITRVMCIRWDIRSSSHSV